MVGPFRVPECVKMKRNLKRFLVSQTTSSLPKEDIAPSHPSHFKIASITKIR